MIKGLNNKTGDWAAVRAFVDGQYTLARQELERHGIGPERTEFLRGRLEAYRHLVNEAEAVTTNLETLTVNYD